MPEALLSQAELQDVAKSVVALANDQLNKQIAEIRAELEKKWAEGFSPADQRVKDLEAKLAERELELDGLVKRHKDEMRLLKGEMAAIGHGYTRPEGGPIDPMRFDFKGAFITREKMRAIVNAFTSGSSLTRAIDTADIATSGKLTAEVADRFIDLIILEQATLSRVMTRRMISPEARLDEMLVNRRQLARATEATPPTPADAVSFRPRTLTTEEVIWAEDITLSFLEDNIERDNAEAHIASALARQFGTDANDLAWSGVADVGVGFTNIRKGYAQLINEITGGTPGETDPVEVITPGSATGTTPVSALFRLMHKAIPERYKARTDYGFFTPTGTAERYADEIQQRETALGDAVTVNGFPNLRYFGRPVWPEPHLAARVFLCPTMAMFYGVHRAIRVDSDFRPRRRAIEYTITARIGYQIIGPQLFVRLSADLPADFL